MTATRHEPCPNHVGTWERQLLEPDREVFAGCQHRKLINEGKAKIRELHIKIGKLTVERVFSTQVRCGWLCW